MSLPIVAQVEVASFAGDPLAVACDCLVIAVGDKGALAAAGSQLDPHTAGWLARSIQSGAIKTAFGELSLLPMPPGFEEAEQCPQTLLFAGVGDSAKLDRGKAFDWGATVLRRLVDSRRERVVMSIDGLVPEQFHDALVAGALTGCDGQSIYASDPKLHAPRRIDWHGVAAEAIAAGKTVGDSLNVIRRLVNEPPNRIYPQSFAEAASAVADEVDLEIEIWDEQRLEAEGCRALLAVGAASARPPRLVMLRHRGGPKSQAPLAIVGKGVTFDSGGLSIKPTDGMIDMKCDMAGAATVVGVMRAIARLKLPLNVIGFCGLVENMIGGNAFKLGDVIESRSGTMIEILNTDAEGRVVLADVLDVAVQQKPLAIIDLATLTGACMVALGRDIAGLMTNDQTLCGEIQAAAKAEGELVWQLPMLELFDEQIKSKVADIKNVGDGRWGGAITAAKFLEQFVDQVPWVHIDIAGPAFAESPKPHRDAGATGVMLRTLLGWLCARAGG